MLNLKLIDKLLSRIEPPKEKTMLTKVLKDSNMKKITLTEFDFRWKDNNHEGICLNCGAEHPDIEPSAKKYECIECFEFKVYSVANLLIMGKIEIVESNRLTELDAIRMIG